MAFKLNLVTLDIRKRMVESVDNNKVHDNEKANIPTKDFKDKKQEMDNKESRKGKKKFFTIDAVKNNGKRLDIEAEIDKDILNEESLGIFVDKKK